MIGQLRGYLVDSAPDGTLVVDVQGVGYELSTPLGAVGRMAKDADGTITLQVHTHVREDALQLFGFPTTEERTTFRTLIAISKVGPKLALTVLGALSVAELVQLVETGQTSLLTKVPGIGKKTAERIVLELKGKLGPVTTARAGTGPAALAPGAHESGQGATLRETLVRMGFKAGEAERAVATLSDLERPLDQLIREALVVLAP
ncbi:MAG: Holliday junction branch migration protein RuvA [Deltaproteobacteria bacterium]|nr:MAG: Holliday junction branch migration protein RuvA [Deltaproteobacteria bacterium]